ncbi:hypothetical protein D9Q98_010234 [Chlorella vulgaris]|uniref:Uncharacterized protein n=1 Tax=Chlorella vulgaris TaxID=3077 RepID=A0A9D4TJS5_CHLVU|nr:hypothetical protein D9Q98_010234 [Chlorella vulgaris]
MCANSCSQSDQPGTSLLALLGLRPQPLALQQRGASGISWQHSIHSITTHGSSSSSLASRSATMDVAGPAQARRHRGKFIASVVPGFDAQQLLRNMQLDDYGSADELSASMGKLPGIRQQGILQHGPQVAAHLRGLGMESSELVLLFCRCPELFSRPAEERAGVLFRQLMGLGLEAGHAASCFEQQPWAAQCCSFEPANAVLASLLAAGSKGGGRTGEQLLGDVLTKHPSAVGLLQYRAELLQHNLDNLLQLGLTKQQVSAALLQSWALLTCSPQHLARMEEVVWQELGADRQLWVKVLGSAARLAGCSEATLRQRAQALVAEFGKEEALRMVDATPQLLAINTVVWRRALAVWQQCGVADRRAVAKSKPILLGYDWLHRSRLANLRALQRWLPWEVSAAQAIACYGRYMVHSPKTLAGRLLYLEQLGLLPLLVADKLAAKREWRLQQGLSGSEKAACEPVFISVSAVAILTAARFDSLVFSALSQQRQQQGGDILVSSSSSSSSPLSFEAFRKGRLLQLPAWKQLLAQAEADVVELERELPPELLQNGTGPAAAAGGKKPAAKRAWRLQQGLSVSKKAAGEPVFISVSDVAAITAARFDSLVDSALSQQRQHDEGLVSSTSSSPSFEAFRKGSLLQLPAWKQLLAQAEADVVELERKLLPALRRVPAEAEGSGGGGAE